MKITPESRTLATFGERVVTKNNPERFTMEVDFANVIINEEFYCNSNKSRTKSKCKSKVFDNSGMWCLIK